MLLLRSFRQRLKTPGSSFRSLSTTYSHPQPPNRAPLLFNQEHNNTDSGMNWVPDMSHPSPNPQLDIKPVYIEMSSLVHDVSGMGSQVAALAPSVFRHPIRRDILHLCVVHHLDSLRQGTAANKSRGEVRGSGAKIRPQKGSGKARLGDGQSPMLRGGGRAFAKKARDFSTKLPRKVIQMGMRVALSAKVKENSLGILESLEWSGVKTNQFARRISELGWRKTLFVTGLETVPDTIDRSSRNIRDVGVITASQLSVYEAVKWERLVLDLSAVGYFENTLGKPHLDGKIDPE